MKVWNDSCMAEPAEVAGTELVLLLAKRSRKTLQFGSTVRHGAENSSPFAAENSCSLSLPYQSTRFFCHFNIAFQPGSDATADWALSSSHLAPNEGAKCEAAFS